MKKGWCPICGKITRTYRYRWLWIFVTLILVRIAFIPYLLYCAITSKRVCGGCKNRIEYHPSKEDWEGRI